MAKFGGVALKGVALFLRFIEFCCAAIVLGIFSYFLATLANHHLPIATYIRAVEGISGAGVLYTAMALIFVCCLGGITVLSLIAIVLDIAFCGAFIYIAWATRGGASTCSGYVSTPFGNGNTGSSNSVIPDNNPDGVIFLPSLRTACKLQTATFAVAIIACIFFLFSALVEVALIKHHKKEKAFGPSPNNGYTAGSPRRKFWQRKPKRDAEYAMGAKNADALPSHATPGDMRTSYATESTAVGEQPVYNKYATGPVAGHHNPAAATQPYHQPGTTGTF